MHYLEMLEIRESAERKAPVQSALAAEAQLGGDLCCVAIGMRFLAWLCYRSGLGCS